MKIIKQGNITKLKEIKTFYCKFCGCLFEADNTEYKKYKIYKIGGSQYKETYYYIECPFCGKKLYKGEGEE